MKDEARDPRWETITPPFQPDRNFAKGKKYANQGKCEKAIDHFKKSKNQPQAAFQIGKCLYDMERYEEAKSFYELSVQLLPSTRTRPSYNKFIRSICKKEQVPMADFETIANKTGKKGFPHDKLFRDYCHLHWYGYYLMTQEVFRVMEEKHWLPVRKLPPKEKPTYQQIIDLNQWDHLKKLPESLINEGEKITSD